MSLTRIWAYLLIAPSPSPSPLPPPIKGGGIYEVSSPLVGEG